MDNSPIVLMDPDGKHPEKKRAIGRKKFRRYLRRNGVNSLKDLHFLMGGTRTTSGIQNPDAKEPKFRYLYSKRWGWVDMKHFAAAAHHTSSPFVTGSYVLKRGEQKEIEQEYSDRSYERASAWDYEDLTSNLMGVTFEDYWDERSYFEVPMEHGDFVTVLDQFLDELGFTEEHPGEAAPNYDWMPYDAHTDDRTQNSTYDPMYTTIPRYRELDENNNIIKIYPIDYKMLDRLNDHLDEDSSRDRRYDTKEDQENMNFRKP